VPLSRYEGTEITKVSFERRITGGAKPSELFDAKYRVGRQIPRRGIAPPNHAASLAASVHIFGAALSFINPSLGLGLPGPTERNLSLVYVLQKEWSLIMAATEERVRRLVIFEIPIRAASLRRVVL
jgi:hypothetical protein